MNSMVVPFYNFVVITSLDVDFYSTVWNFKTNINKTLLNSIKYDGETSVILYNSNNENINEENIKTILNEKTPQKFVHYSDEDEMYRVLKRIEDYNEL